MNGLLLRRFALFAALAVGGCALDVWTKNRMFARLGLPGMGPVEWIWPGIFGFQTSLNEGALFGFGQGMVWIFAGLSCMAAIAILYWLFVAGAARDALLTAALGSVMAGVMGNLYDRLGLWWRPEFAGFPRHAVRDWILLKYENWVWPNFNVADMMLVGGAMLLVWHAWQTPHPSDRANSSAADAAPRG